MSEKKRSSHLSNFKLNTLLKITELINGNVDTSELLIVYRQVLENELNIGKCMLFDASDGGECLLRYGFTGRAEQSVETAKELAKHSDINTVSGFEPGNEKEYDIVVPVFHEEKPFALLIIGDIDENVQGLSPAIKHLRFIQTLTNIIMVAIENKKLYKESLKQVALKKELDLAAKMQSALIPRKEDYPGIKGIHFSSYYLPHLEVGGDYYDILQLDDDTIGFCIADVSGKGVAAAMLMSNFQAIIRALFTSHIDLGQLASKLNDLINRNARGEKFITLFIGRIRLSSLEMEYINAAHVYPLLYLPQSKNIIELSSGCIGIGMLDELFNIEIGHINLEPGSKLICFTDGLTEFRFGENKHEKLEIEEYLSTTNSIDQVLEKLVEKITELKKINAIFDDISIISLEVDSNYRLQK